MDWNSIGPVTVHTVHGVRSFVSLTEAVISIGGYALDKLTERPYIVPTEHHRDSRFFTEYRFPNLSGFGTTHIVYDEMGIRIPVWKLREVFYNLPETVRNPRRLGYYRSWWRYFGYKPDVHFRNGPVPGIRCCRGSSRYFRRVRTYAERRDFFRIEADIEDAFEFGGMIKIRAARNDVNLPTSWDDIRDARRGDGWKNYRRTQYKTKKE